MSEHTPKIMIPTNLGPATHIETPARIRASADRKWIPAAELGTPQLRNEYVLAKTADKWKRQRDEILEALKHVRQWEGDFDLAVVNDAIAKAEGTDD